MHGCQIQESLCKQQRLLAQADIWNLMDITTFNVMAELQLYHSRWCYCDFSFTCFIAFLLLTGQMFPSNCPQASEQLWIFKAVTQFSKSLFILYFFTKNQGNILTSTLSSDWSGASWWRRLRLGLAASRRQRHRVFAPVVQVSAASRFLRADLLSLSYRGGLWFLWPRAR